MKCLTSAYLALWASTNIFFCHNKYELTSCMLMLNLISQAWILLAEHTSSLHLYATISCWFLWLIFEKQNSLLLQKVSQISPNLVTLCNEYWQYMSLNNQIFSWITNSYQLTTNLTLRLRIMLNQEFIWEVAWDSHVSFRNVFRIFYPFPNKMLLKNDIGSFSPN